MKSFRNVFSYEFKTQMYKRSAIVTMVVIMVIMLAVTSLPWIISLFEGSSKEDAGAGLGSSGIENAGYVIPSDAQTQAILGPILGEKAKAYGTRDQLVEALANQDITVGFVVNPDLSYEVVYQDKPMHDSSDTVFGEIITAAKKQQMVTSLGLTAEDYLTLENTRAEGTVTILKQDSGSNYFIIFGMMLLVYFIVLMYGSSVSSIIAREKDSRTMEILITSTKPSYLIIGKVAAAGMAAVIQFGAIVLVTIIGFQLNKSTYPPELLMMVQGSLTPSYVWSYLFFSLFGFILYLFLYASLGSTVSKMEDLASATGLVQFLFIAAYILATFAAQMPSSPVAVIGSIVPLTSLMVMPIRVGLVTVPWSQLIAAGVLLILTLVFFAYLSIKIYRWGSLNYGNKTRLGRIIKEALRKS